MTQAAVRADRSAAGMARVSAALWRRAWLRATLTLTPPLAWFLVIYLASLVVMLITSFWTVNSFTNTIEHAWSWPTSSNSSPASTRASSGGPSPWPRLSPSPTR